MAIFVLEIGSEELPARFLPLAERELTTRFAAALDEKSLSHGKIRCMTTPRRAAVIIDDLSPVQEEREEVVSGPSERAAFDPAGNPTKALLGFARAQGVDIGDVFRIETDKGAYVAVRKKSGGRPAAELLAEMCPAIITAVPFPKRMRWGEYSLAYARPLRWILALLDDAVIRFNVGPLPAGRETRGHRVHGPGPFSIAHARDYEATLARQCAVTLDAGRRRADIIREGDALAGSIGGRVLWKESLLDEVQGLVEHPVPLLGSFDPAYLDVPYEVLLTSMEEHQKSFGIAAPDGTLMPYFLTVLNLTPADTELTRHGWERVLRARLDDARFFWRSDLRESFEKWLEQLASVIFIGPLGSMDEKALRLEKLCGWLAGLCAPSDALLAQEASRAGRIAKADLVTGMVGEFDSLQGIMGGIYADRMGESAGVALALREQYLPSGPNSPLPGSLPGAILSMADKADTLAGCFGLDMIPTGAADPNGLRRCALGIIRILLQFGLDCDVRELFVEARRLYGERQWKFSPEAALDKLVAFFAARLRHYFLAEGNDALLVDATLNAGATRVADCRSRLLALADFRREEGFAEAVQTFKRVSNIVRKQGAGECIPERWQVALLSEKPEMDLAALLDTLLPRLEKNMATGDYRAALSALKEIRPAVDAFFDGVMVMCDDLALRRNRLAMLNALALRFSGLADFTALQV